LSLSSGKKGGKISIQLPKEQIRKDLRIHGQVLDEEFHLILPIYTRVQKINVRIQKTDAETNIGTKDLQTLDMIVSLNWHIDPKKVNYIYQQVGNNSTIQTNIIVPAISEVLKAATPNEMPRKS
jgi:prohibitin 1